MAGHGHFRIVREEPPPKRGTKRPLGELQAFLRHVRKNAPGDWVRLYKDCSSASYVYKVRNSMFPEMDIVTRKLGTGKLGVWIKFPAPTPAATVSTPSWEPPGF